MFKFTNSIWFYYLRERFEYVPEMWIKCGNNYVKLETLFAEKTWDRKVFLTLGSMTGNMCQSLLNNSSQILPDVIWKHYLKELSIYWFLFDV